MKQQEENKKQNHSQIGNNKNTDCSSEKDKIDEIDELLYNYFKQNREVPESTTKVIETTLYNKKNAKAKSTKNIHNFRFILSKVAIFILCISVIGTGVTFASNISNFFKNLFGLNNVGINNASVVSAIENNYVQNVDMDYIKVNDDYSIKIDYLMMDDINLYTVFNIYSENGFDTNYRISILDLKIMADDELIYDISKENNCTIDVSTGYKQIVQEENTIKRELMFLMSDEFPKAKKLEYKFSKITLYNNSAPTENIIEINCDKEITIEIDVIDKFINRDVLYIDVNNESSLYKINKFIANDTGTYLVYETEKPEVQIELVYNSKVYEGEQGGLGSNGDSYVFVLQYNINMYEITEASKIELKEEMGEKMEIEPIENMNQIE